jgi:hypothetical protein
MYHKNHLNLGDECFGPELQKTFQDAIDLMNRFSEDPFEPKKHEYKEIFNEIINTGDHMSKACHVKWLYDDMNDWCLTNSDACLGSDSDFNNRMKEHAPALLSNGFNFLKSAWKLDDCMTDVETIEEIGDIVREISSIISYMMGFDRKFDLDKKLPHYSNTEYEEKTLEYYRSIYGDDYVPVEEYDF